MLVKYQQRIYPIGLVLFSYVFSVMMSMIIIGAVVIRWRTLPNTEYVTGIILIVMLVPGIFIHTQSLVAALNTPPKFSTDLQKGLIFLYQPFHRKVEIEYSEIETIKFIFRTSLRIGYSSKGKRGFFIIRPDRVTIENEPSLGVFLEEIFVRASNIRKLEFGSFLDSAPKNSAIWGKEPDLLLIDRVREVTLKLKK